MSKLLPLFLLCALIVPAAATTVTLYDASLNTGPVSQGWGFATLPLMGPYPTGSLSGGAYQFSTTAGSTIRAGFFQVFAVPFVLDPAYGFRYRVDMKVNSESHSSTDRAGFSIIALSNTLAGIELGFWEDEIWAQSGPAFKHAEGKSFNTKSAITRYELTVKGTGYSLTADGAPLLAGSLRDYSSFGAPYNAKNFLFFGDNTTSANASVAVRYISLTQIPEPGMLLPVAVAVAVFALRRSRG